MPDRSEIKIIGIPSRELVQWGLSHGLPSDANLRNRLMYRRRKGLPCPPAYLHAGELHWPEDSLLDYIAGRYA